MDKVQTTKSNTQLIPSSDREGSVLQDKKTFTYLLKVFESIGGTVNTKTAYLIERSAQKHNLTVAEAEAGLLWAMENCHYKPTWADVIKGKDSQKKGDQSIFRSLND